MRFKNLKLNILDYLQNEYEGVNLSEPVKAQKVLEQFSAIPAKNIRDAIYSMEQKGLIKIISSDDSISLTRKGMSKKSLGALYNL
jgi:hypothetical protein